VGHPRDPAVAAVRSPISGSRAERYLVVLHVEPSTLSAEGEPGRSELEDGTRLVAETARRLACDASVVRLLHEGGAVLDVGRRTRTIPPALRRAIEARDRGCRFPGCGVRFTDIHHVRHWADGGETKLSNCLSLCRFHHRLLHEHGYTVKLSQHGRATFHTPRGMPLPNEPLRLRLEGDLVAELVRENRRRGIDPGYATGSAASKREDDVAFPLVARALEAVAAARSR
jgi:hypothetical protein